MEALSARERGQLEAALMHRFMDGSHNMHATTAEGGLANLPPVPPEARAAMQAWLMVQSARLRHIDPNAVEPTARDLRRSHVMDGPHGSRACFEHEQFQQEARATLGNSHAFSDRPEYADALNNFLMLLEPDRPLHPVLRSQVVAAFNDHRLEGRISRRVNDVIDAHGIEAMAEQRYRLNGLTGHFRPRDKQRGLTPPRTPERAMVPVPSGEGSSSAASHPEPVEVPPALNLTHEEQRWLNHTLDLSHAPRERTGKLPDSEQYQRIKSMPSESRAALEATLEHMFMPLAGRAVPATALSALEGWLTAQQVRLRVHSEASLKQHRKALHSFGHAAKVVKAKLGGSRGQSEFSRFHSEHESAMRPEYAVALNNFLRVLHPSSPLSPELKQHVAARLMYHAETEGTISDQVLGELQHYKPIPLAAAGWGLDPVSNVFSPPLPPVASVIGPGTPGDPDNIQTIRRIATPSPLRHKPLTPPRR